MRSSGLPWQPGRVPTTSRPAVRGGRPDGIATVRLPASHYRDLHRSLQPGVRFVPVVSASAGRALGFTRVIRNFGPERRIVYAARVNHLSSMRTADHDVPDGVRGQELGVHVAQGLNQAPVAAAGQRPATREHS
jgi:hypothetical protein